MARITTIRNVIAIGGDDLVDHDRDAFSLSLLWAQTVALQTSADMASNGYQSAVRSELSRIAWIVTEASATTYRERGDRLTPADAVRSMLSPYVSPADLALTTDLLDTMTGEAPGAGLAGMLTTWWASQTTASTTSAFVTGPLRRSSDGLKAEVLFYNFDYTATDWQSFFARRSSQGVAITARPMTFTLSDAIWADIKQTLSDKLGERASEYIQNLDIAL